MNQSLFVEGSEQSFTARGSCMSLLAHSPRGADGPDLPHLLDTLSLTLPSLSHFIIGGQVKTEDLWH